MCSDGCRPLTGIRRRRRTLLSHYGEICALPQQAGRQNHSQGHCKMQRPCHGRKFYTFFAYTVYIKLYSASRNNMPRQCISTRIHTRACPHTPIYTYVHIFTYIDTHAIHAGSQEYMISHLTVESNSTHRSLYLQVLLVLQGLVTRLIKPNTLRLCCYFCSGRFHVTPAFVQRTCTLCRTKQHTFLRVWGNVCPGVAAFNK